MSDCPECGGKSAILSTRRPVNGLTIRRRKMCLVCLHRWTEREETGKDRKPLAYMVDGKFNNLTSQTGVIKYTDSLTLRVRFDYLNPEDYDQEGLIIRGLWTENEGGLVSIYSIYSNCEEFKAQVDVAVMEAYKKGEQE